MLLLPNSIGKVNIHRLQPKCLVLLFNKELRQNLPKMDYDINVLIQRYFDFFGNAITKAFETIHAMGLRDSKLQNTI